MKEKLADALGVDAQVGRYRAALEASILRDLMSAEQRSERVGLFRSRVETRDEGERTTERVREGWFRRIEVVTVSSTSEGFTIEPVRGHDGRIDVEASVLHARLHHDATIPHIADIRLSLLQRGAMHYFRWRARKAPVDHGSGWEEFLALQDASARAAYCRARAEEEGRG